MSELKSIASRFAGLPGFGEVRSRLADRTGSVSIEGIGPASFPLVIASLFLQKAGPVLVVTENTQRLQEMVTDLSCFLDEGTVLPLPPWDTLPYEFVSPPEKTERERVTALYRLLAGTPGVVVTAAESLMRRIPARDFFLKKGMTLEVGDDYPFDDLLELLVSYGYSRESRVEAYGQFAVKGGIIDVFLPSHEAPVRLDFFGDTLDSIREFDPDTQISQAARTSVTVYPRKELVLFSREREALLRILSAELTAGRDFPDELAEQVREGRLDRIGGIEELFPLVMGSETLLDYLPPGARVVLVEPQELILKANSTEKIFRELHSRKKDETLCLEPERLIDTGALERARENALVLQTFTTTSEALTWPLRSIPNFHGRISRVREEIAARIADGWRIVITTAFEGQARRLYDLLSEFSPGSGFEALDESLDLNIIITSLREGVEITDLKLLLLSDHEIFGKSYRKRRQFKRKTSRPIESFIELKQGDYVVHINHGIGIFRKTERMSAGGVERDFLMIEYAEGDKLYVSLDQITMVQKYIGMEGRKPRVDHLGRKSAWNRIKDRVRESVEEIARELVKIYSVRTALKGFPYPPDTLWQEEFESKFEYEETPDQITAIEDVKDDMESAKPMDRLVCGDVGFGKTEVAIRAAFKAVMAGRQVAVLVPTTVLAMQHFSTFKRRFSEYPIAVDMASRFRTPLELRSAKERLLKGEIDIIIGTHALLSKDMQFKTLGLLIIDEEQRFGVKHKEQIKKFRALVDVLTLSATPIPRTMHMAMAGIRDLSIIQTPPENRQSIETYVLEDNPEILRMAIRREIERGGQVFYVHNRVQTIDLQAAELRRLVPEARVCVAHGQMHEHELEDVMIAFLNQEYDVLASTTIIESGLDMPTVNTIVINRADTFGLSQLYQLKGRVGRSVTKAYAYLFYPRHIPLTEEATKRLQVISEYSELGSGFKIAMKDLEIRGAGNILGHEQSGNIMEVGFDLYTQMLEEAVRGLKGEKPLQVFRTPVFMKTDFFIPDSYIADEKQKIEFYKRFEACESLEEMDALEKELTDRFGTYPPEVNVLIELERIRTLASGLMIEEILEDSRSIRIKMSGDTRINRSRLVKMISSDKRISLDPADPSLLLLKPHSGESEKKLLELKKFLQGCH